MSLQDNDGFNAGCWGCLFLIEFAGIILYSFGVFDGLSDKISKIASYCSDGFSNIVSDLSFVWTVTWRVVILILGVAALVGFLQLIGFFLSKNKKPHLPESKPAPKLVATKPAPEPVVTKPAPEPVATKPALEPVIKEKKCPVCGSKVMSDAESCQDCGHSFVATPPTPELSNLLISAPKTPIFHGLCIFCKKPLSGQKESLVCEDCIKVQKEDSQKPTETIITTKRCPTCGLEAMFDAGICQDCGFPFSESQTISESPVGESTKERPKLQKCITCGKFLPKNRSLLCVKCAGSSS